MESNDLRNRYLFTTFDELMQRVANEISINESDHHFWRQKFFQILINREFCPSGNTLVAGKKPVRPNCSILGTINDENQEQVIERSKRLWKHAIGVGYSIETGDPVETLKRLSFENQQIDLGHRPQRGNIAILHIDHPQLESFTSYKFNQLIKGDQNAIYNFNISVAVTNEFMEAVIDGNPQKWKNTDKTAKEWLKRIAFYAHQSGDPGIVFIDRVQDDDFLTRKLGPVKAAVPCGEQFLHDLETCNLGAINLNADSFLQNNEIQWKRLKEVIWASVRFLDNVVDLLDIPDEEMKQISLDLRRIGLGITGWADLLKKLNLEYHSEEAQKLGHSISKFFTEEAMAASRELAKERGPCKYCRDRRNISVTCIQPTGGITLLLENKGYGIEPFFKESNNIHFKDHLRMQSVWQKNINQAISKTINMPEECTVQDVFQAFVEAYRLQCKGVTVYREGSRDSEPIKTGRCTTCEEGVCPADLEKEDKMSLLNFLFAMKLWAPKQHYKLFTKNEKYTRKWSKKNFLVTRRNVALRKVYFM
jgi:ribonucleotide reductase alpha subunit